jgi:uncharacterized protein YbcI
VSNASQRLARPSGNVLLDIANAFVGLHKEYYGRGPTKTRAYVYHDLVVVVMQGGYTQAEHTLQDHGREDTVNEGRLAMQATIGPESIATIERLTGRTVYSFLSANDPSRELQSEMFVLEPEQVEPVQRSDLAARARAAREESVRVRTDLRAVRAEQIQARSALVRSRKRILGV